MDTDRHAPSDSAAEAAPPRSFIKVIADLAQAHAGRDITLGTIVDQLDEQAFGLLIFLLAIPCLVPGLPGAQLIAVPIFLLALQLAAGRHEPWLPRRALAAVVKAPWLASTAGFATKRLRWTERLSRPRLGFAATGLAERLAGLVIALAAVTIMLPITNTIPSLAITLMAVGLLQRDGLFTLAGAALATGWITALVVLVWGLATGAGFALELARDLAPWAVEWFGH